MSGKNRLLDSHLYLYLTEFFAGMALMAVEIGAQRLISPYFSSSQIVWTIIIGTIMIAMALGNVYGGRTADRDPHPDRLYNRILLASLWLALIPAVGKYLIIGISGLLILAIDTHFLVLLPCSTPFIKIFLNYLYFCTNETIYLFFGNSHSLACILPCFAGFL